MRPKLKSFLIAFSICSILLLSGCTTSANGPATVADTPSRAQLPNGNYISWAEHTIDDETLGGGIRLRGGDGLKIADLDKDGHVDVISVHKESNHVRAAFGFEDPDEWFRISLAEGAEAGAPADVAIGDLNRDGFPDAIVACEAGHLLYLQNPAGVVRGWRWPRVIPEITAGRGGFNRVFFADLDGDGKLDVVASNHAANRDEASAAVKPLTEISWFQVPEDPLDGAGWREHVLGEVAAPINSQPVDMDGDGDTDVVGGSSGEERIFWFENMGGKQGGEDARKESLAAGEAVRGDAGEAATFQEHPITLQGADSGAQGPLRTSGSSLDFADFNADGRLDVITLALEPKGAIFWLEQPSDPAQPWPVHHVGTIAPDHAAGIAVADINADERPDVIVGGYSRGPSEEDSEEVTPSDPVGRIAWFANPEDVTTAWARHDISPRQRGMFDSFVPLDIDDDGDIDFMGTRGSSGALDGVFWLQQMFSGVPAGAFTPAREEGSKALPLPPS